jgi:hypothetical protein
MYLSTCSYMMSCNLHTNHVHSRNITRKISYVQSLYTKYNIHIYFSQNCQSMNKFIMDCQTYWTFIQQINPRTIILYFKNNSYIWEQLYPTFSNIQGTAFSTSLVISENIYTIHVLYQTYNTIILYILYFIKHTMNCTFYTSHIGEHLYYTSSNILHFTQNCHIWVVHLE